MTIADLSLVMTALGYALWYHLLAKHDVNQVMPFLLLLPVTTVAGGVLFLGETLTLHTVIGGMLAIGGVAVINLWPTRV
jgi:O-acetylserine/cysteine efflux transporter